MLSSKDYVKQINYYQLHVYVYVTNNNNTNKMIYMSMYIMLEQRKVYFTLRHAQKVGAYRPDRPPFQEKHRPTYPLVSRSRRKAFDPESVVLEQYRGTCIFNYAIKLMLKPPPNGS